MEDGGWRVLWMTEGGLKLWREEGKKRERAKKGTDAAGRRREMRAKKVRGASVSGYCRERGGGGGLGYAQGRDRIFLRTVIFVPRFDLALYSTCLLAE